MTPRELLAQPFGFESFRPGQEAVIGALLAGRSALAVFPTGAGKSLCYQLPALALEGVTLVVSPLIALMKDQMDFLVGRGIPAARLDSSLSAAETRQVEAQMRSGDLKLVYVAPERFNNERFLSALGRTQIALFAVDEAHCISEWGHNFRPDYLKLASAARDLRAERVLALTATATPDVVRDICAGFGIDPDCVTLTGFYRPNLNLAVTPVAAQDRDALLLKRIQSRAPGPAIVYVTLQRTAERVAALLAEAGLPAEAYHAGMEPDVRHRVQETWTASERGIVVATIAFGMGIDKPDVRYVYHYNLPKSLESYSQEIGRAGRDGAVSIVEMLACPDDVSTLCNFAYGDTPTNGAVRRLLSELLSDACDPATAPALDLDLFDLSYRHDLRPLVLRTLLTYLELEGALRQGTPFYAGYELRPLAPIPEIVAGFQGEPARLVESLFDRAEKGRTWYRLNPDTISAELGQERRRIVRALEVLEERQAIELRVADVRQRYFRLRPSEDVDSLVAELTARFERREQNEIARLQDVLNLVSCDGCLSNALVAHFGEIRPTPCGHCTVCKTGAPRQMPPSSPLPALPAAIDPDELLAVCREHVDALGEPRQVARFLCGLASPALTRRRLGRHSLFGALQSYPFADVLAWLTSA
jgi:ATP-dependent DNA helicase RecQ